MRGKTRRNRGKPHLKFHQINTKCSSHTWEILVPYNSIYVFEVDCFRASNKKYIVKRLLRLKEVSSIQEQIRDSPFSLFCRLSQEISFYFLRHQNDYQKMRTTRRQQIASNAALLANAENISHTKPRIRFCLWLTIHSLASGLSAFALFSALLFNFRRLMNC